MSIKRILRENEYSILGSFPKFYIFFRRDIMTKNGVEI
jgi:hypothetical protein